MSGHKPSAHARFEGGSIEVYLGPDRLLVGEGEGEHSPLEIFVASLAGCEAHVYKTVLETLGYEPEVVEVKCSGEFEGPHGVRRLELEVRVGGVEEEDARRIWNLAKIQCPIYATLLKAGVEIVEHFEAEP